MDTRLTELFNPRYPHNGSSTGRALARAGQRWP